MSKKISLFKLCAILLVAVFALSACQPKAVQETPAAVQETTAPVVAATAVPTIAPTPTEVSKIGGTLVIATSDEPDTLDCQLTAMGVASHICGLMGGSLVSLDPVSGDPVPYLASSWVIADDGMTYTFTLKDGIKFADGSPLTAADYAFTINRAVNPDTGSPGTSQMLGGVTSAEATDALTLVLHMAYPNAVLLQSISDPGYLMPYSQAYVEAHDADFLARNPMSVGPYIFKEWNTGEKITMTRNPDYTWGPAYGSGEPYNIETIEYRFIPEESTLVAGLEAGEIGAAEVTFKDVAALQDSGNFTVYEGLDYGVYTLIMNTSLPPFNTLEGRQAMNYAIDRQALVDVVVQGEAIVAYGPFSPAVYGYDETLAQTGYSYDPAKTKQLFEGLGYTLNADGIYEKDGQPLTFTLNSMDMTATGIKTAEVLQQQLKAVGVDTTIQQMELGVAIQNLFTGQFQLSVMEYGMPNASILNLIYSKQAAGAAVFATIDTGPIEDQLTGIMAITDPAAWLDNVHAVQQSIVQQALIVPMYHLKRFNVVTTQLNDVLFRQLDNKVLYNNAYFTLP
jgi:peptide/nickel transport system substrate-binding protein